MDEETAEGSHLYGYRPWSHATVAVGHKTSEQPLLPMRGDSERGSPNEVPIGGRRKREKPQASRGGQRMVSDGCGFSWIDSISVIVSCFGLLAILDFVCTLHVFCM